MYTMECWLSIFSPFTTSNVYKTHNEQVVVTGSIPSIVLTTSFNTSGKSDRSPPAAVAPIKILLSYLIDCPKSKLTIPQSW